MRAKMIESPNDPILQEDLEQLVNESPNVDSLANSNILITGATGLLGSQLIKFLICLNRMKHTNIHVIANIRNEEKAHKIFGHLLPNNDLSFLVGDINNPINYDKSIDYIIHGASATNSQFFVNYPVDTIVTAINGTNNVLLLAKEKSIKSMVYLSSLEVYGIQDKEGSEYIKEDEYGHIDPLNVRSSYSEGKRMVECLCASYVKQYNMPIKIARLSQTFGAGVAYHDGRVFAEFARCVIEKKDIILHTSGQTVRTYCYTKDAIAAIITILTNGTKGEAYNVANMYTSISIYNMAKLVCDTFPHANINVHRRIPKNIEKFGYNPEMVVKLNSEKLQTLGWKPNVCLTDMFIRMINSMKMRINK